MLNHLHIICYRWGTKYGVEYVNTLHAMVKRNLTIPHTFHCITDDPTRLEPGIVAHELPDTGVEGIWRKLMTFQKNFLGLEGEYVVSLDLDMVIVDNINFLAEQPEKAFIIARNWSKDALKGTGARASGSVYRLKVGSHPEIWEDLIKDFSGAVDRYHGKTREIGEQNWLDAHFKQFDFFPEGKVVSFKRHCNAKGRKLLGINTARFGKAQPPPGAAIVSFHGDPLPPDVMFTTHGRWRHAPFVQKHWRYIPAEPLFGVIIPTYNRPDDLKTALHSLLNQSYPNWCVAVVDDASTISYESVKEEFSDPRIHFMDAPENRGINAARNIGLDFLLNHGADFLSFLDDDDEFAPDFFAKAIEIIRKHPEFDWFMSNNYGERKKSQQDIQEIRVLDWIDDYIYKKFRGDKAHIFSKYIIRDIRLDDRYRASNRWKFYIDLGERSKILAYPHPSIRKQYQEGGITKGIKGAYKGPKTWLEISSRFAKHLYAAKHHPTQWKAYKYFLLELLKTPRRVIHLYLKKS